MTFSTANYYRDMANPLGEQSNHILWKNRIVIEEHGKQASQRRVKQTKITSRSISPDDHLVDLLSGGGSPVTSNRAILRDYPSFQASSKLKKSSRQLSNGGKMLLRRKLLQSPDVRALSRNDNYSPGGHLTERRDRDSVFDHRRMVSLKDRASVLGLVRDENVSTQLNALTSPKKLRSRDEMHSPTGSYRDVLSKRGADLMASPDQRSVVGGREASSKGSLFDKGFSHTSSRVISKSSRRESMASRMFSPGGASSKESLANQSLAFKPRSKDSVNKNSAGNKVLALRNLKSGTKGLEDKRMRFSRVSDDGRHNKAPIRGGLGENGQRTLAASRSEATITPHSVRSVDSFGLRLTKPKARVLPDISQAEYDQLTKNQKKISPGVGHNKAIEDFWNKSGKLSDLKTLIRPKFTKTGDLKV